MRYIGKDGRVIWAQIVEAALSEEGSFEVGAHHGAGHHRTPACPRRAKGERGGATPSEAVLGVPARAQSRRDRDDDMDDEIAV